MIRSAICAIALCGTAQAGTFQVPKGCQAYLTVHALNCQVEHHWTCDADAPGDKWHGEVSANGLSYVGMVDHEAQWIDSFFANVGEHNRLIQPADDPASLTELFASGLDTYDFTLQTPNGVYRVVGYDRIAQRNVEIDGEALHQTEYSIRITDENDRETHVGTGFEYVSETHRRFFSGYGDISGPGTPYSYNSSPVEFIYPDEKGFLDNTPKYGCDVLSAGAVTQAERTPRHDL